MSLYAWLFKMNGFAVADTGYFVYCNGLTSRDAFNQRLEFDISILPYVIDDAWVERAIIDAHTCLSSVTVPTSDRDCDYCAYHFALVRI
jgi:hypothetical protein